MTNGFTELNLRPQLIEAITELGYLTPTPIQAAVIPAMLAGGDVIGQAQTGTGKTAAFALPILQNLQPQENKVQSLVIAPTRELAVQVSQSVYNYGKCQGVRVLAVYGGQPYERQVRRLQKGVQVVVGTPGRLLDLIQQEVLDLSSVNTLVLDEADEMLSMGFIEDIESILACLTSVHQTALFSATVPPPIRLLADKYMNQPEAITIETAQRTVASIDQRYYIVNATDKIKALARLFEVEEITSALIFARTRVETSIVANELSVRGFQAEVLNGDLNQQTREHVLSQFQKNKIKVLVATDIAARGLDIGHLSHVINFDLPQFVESYVHRVGRTARAGKPGIAITLIAPKELWRLRKIEAYTRQKITLSLLPTIEVIEAKREMALIERISIWLKRGRYSKELQLTAQLIEAGYDPLDIAAATIKILRSEERRRPIEPIEDVSTRPLRDSHRNSKRVKTDSRRPPRYASHEKGMVRLTFSAGKLHGVRPNDVVGTIARHAQIPGRTIGSIRIQEQDTLVDIPEQFVAQVLAKNGQYQVHKRSITIERPTS